MGVLSECEDNASPVPLPGSQPDALMESQLKSKQQIINHKEIRRAEQRGHQAEESAKRQSRQICSLT